jgi:hypothetical protein
VLELDDIVRNRVVVECNNLFLEMDATDGINLDVDVLDILVRGIIFAKGVIGSENNKIMYNYRKC